MYTKIFYCYKNNGTRQLMLSIEWSGKSLITILKEESVQDEDDDNDDVDW